MSAVQLASTRNLPLWVVVHGRLVDMHIRITYGGIMVSLQETLPGMIYDITVLLRD